MSNEKKPEHHDRLVPCEVSLPWFAALAIAKLAVHVPSLGRYDYHGDELYFIQCGLRLDWGYVDHPPLLPWLVRATGEVLGYSLPALRWLPLLAGILLVYLTMRMAARLGGSGRAQALAGAAVLLAPAYLRMATMVNIPAFEQVLWALATLCFLDLVLDDARARMWQIGLLVGVGLLLKYTFLLFAAAYAVALLLHRRETFRDPRLWIGGALALLLWSPNLVWQVQHDWAHLQFLRNISDADGMLGQVPRFLFLAGQILYFNPAVVPIWFAGLYALWRRPCLRPAVWLYLAPLILLFVTNGKPYYLAPAYPLLFAAGATYWTSRLQTWIGWTALIGPMSVVGLFFAFLTLPYLPLQQMDDMIDSVLLGQVPARDLTHDYHNQLNWRHYGPALQVIYDAMPPDEQRGTLVITAFYGQASGLHFLASPHGGQSLHLPPVVSPHLTWTYWPPDFEKVQSALVLAIPEEILRQHFDVVEQVAAIPSPTQPDLAPEPVFRVEGAKRPWFQIWQDLKWFRNSAYRVVTE